MRLRLSLEPRRCGFAHLCVACPRKLGTRLVGRRGGGKVHQAERGVGQPLLLLEERLESALRLILARLAMRRLHPVWRRPTCGREPRA